MESMIITNGTIVTLGKTNNIINNGAIYIEKGLIREIGNTNALVKKHLNSKRLDAAGKIIMPGMICAHHHLYSTMARGMAPPGAPAANFQEILQRLWWKLDSALLPDDIYYSAILPLIDCIKNGTTTLIDHHASPGARDGSLDIIEKAVLDAGLRASLCYEVSDRNRNAEGLDENIRFIRKCRDMEADHASQISAMMGMHASMTLSPATLESCVGNANDLGVGCHVHAAEDISDRVDSVHKYNVPTLKRLIDAGAGGEKSLFIHCVHVDTDELEQLKASGTTVVHCPESNMNNAVGVTPVLEMMKKEDHQAPVLVGLGTDGMTSNMFLQTRIAYLLQRVHTRDPRVAFSEAPQMLFMNNPKIANRMFPQTPGELREGGAADIIILDYNSPTPFTRDNLAGHLIFGLYDAPVETTICRGKILMKNRNIQNLDIEKLYAKSAELAEQLWKRIS